MEKILALAAQLGAEIAVSDQLKAVENTQNAYECDAALQALLAEHETDRKLLSEEFSKSTDEADQRAIADLRARMEELGKEIMKNENYIAFAEAQKAMNALMTAVNAEIKFAITGERPAECTHDCSTCHADCSSRG